MAAPAKDPITCHVLDTTTGRPAANIAVKLVCCDVPEIVFTCKTNADGRIMQWGNTQGSHGDIGAFVESHGGVTTTLQWMIGQYHQTGSGAWKLEFDTGSYYGTGRTFFPKVELTFLVTEGEHYHVPLLLGPYSFTTYRGS